MSNTAGSDRDEIRPSLPVLGICGHSGAGKTTLIEQVLPWLIREGLAVAVIKFDAQGLNIDTPGKDSDRFFQAGADVLAVGPREKFMRCTRGTDSKLQSILPQLCQSHDLVLVEGHKDSQLPKVWLLSEHEQLPPGGIPNVLEVLGRRDDRAARLLNLIVAVLQRHQARTPIFGGVLIGGRSRRMGIPKHLLTGKADGTTWLERTIALLDRFCEQVAILGPGQVPDSLAGRLRLPDAPGLGGPLSGMLSAMRWAPGANWLMVACDLPQVSAEALEWLLATRRAGVWASLPVLEAGLPEPLLAHYDYRSRAILEQLAAQGDFRPGLAATHRKAISPIVPERLQSAWLNVNTQQDLEALG